MALGREVAVHGLTRHTQLRVEARVAETEVTHNLVLVTNTRSPLSRDNLADTLFISAR